MPESRRSSDYPPSLLTNSDSLPSSPFSDQNGVNGYFENTRSQDDVAIGPPYDGTINPQLLDMRSGSVDTVGRWMELPVPSQAAELLAYDGFAAAEEAVQLVQHESLTYVDDAPWVPSQHRGHQAAQGSNRSVAKGSTAAQLEAEHHPTRTLIYQAAHAHRVSSLSTDFNAGAGTVRPSNNSNIPEISREKVPIERSKSTSAISDSSSSSFSCDECGKVLSREGDLKRHNIGQHGASKIFYRCDKCGWDDRRLDKVKGHCHDKHAQETGFERYSEEFGDPARVKRPRGPNKKLRDGKA